MPGDPKSPFPNSQKPYVRYLKGGQSLDVNGNVVPKNTPEAHIPLKDSYGASDLMAMARNGATMKAQDWHAGLIQSLEEVSDIEAQRAAWVDRTNTHFPVPAELICQIFDDSGIDDLLAEGVIFSEATDAALRRFSTLAARLDLDDEPERLMSSKGWLEFAREAARVLALVREDLAE